MKTAKKIYCIVLLFLTFFWIKGHSQSIENALLWEVSGNGISESSFIYGTMHTLCEEDFVISDELVAAFEATDQLVMELDMDDPDLMNQMQTAMVSPVPLSKKLSAEEFNTLDSIMLLKTSMSLQMMDNFNLQSISSLVMLKSLPCETPKIYEYEFLAMAKEIQKEVVGLETVAEQMRYFGKAFSDEFLLKQLFEIEKHEEVFTEMVESYKKQDLGKLYTFVTDEKYADVETEKWLLIERNKNWIKLLPEMMEKRSSLIAVGAAHLIGDSGVIKLLRSKGYTVKPVNN